MQGIPYVLFANFTTISHSFSIYYSLLNPWISTFICTTKRLAPIGHLFKQWTIRLNQANFFSWVKFSLTIWSILTKQSNLKSKIRNCYEPKKQAWEVIYIICERFGPGRCFIAREDRPFQNSATGLCNRIYVGLFFCAMISMTSDEIDWNITLLRWIFFRSLCTFLGRWDLDTRIYSEKSMCWLNKNLFWTVKFVWANGKKRKKN